MSPKEIRMRTIEVEIADVILLVEYELEYDAGYLHDSDGHGLPPSCELEITNIFIGEIDVTELVLWHAPSIVKSIEEQIFENR